MRRAPTGFALIAVLGVVALVSVTTAAAFLIERDTVRSGINRRALVRATWTAEGCAAAMLARLESSGWERYDLADTHGIDPACSVSLVPVGRTWTTRYRDEVVLRRLTRAMCGSGACGDSLADALLDWEDADTVARASGAEWSWYGGRQLLPPSNAPVRHAAELAAVRGWSRFNATTPLVGVDSARVSLRHAPLAVLLALRGVTPETAHAIVGARQATDLADWARVMEGISAAARDSLREASVWLATHATWSPDAWDVVVLSPPTRKPQAVLRLRLARAGQRPAVSQRAIAW